MPVRQIFCQECGTPFTTTRADTVFCSPKCTARWARDTGYYRERIHEEKVEENEKPCEHCGTMFNFNEYADRQGDRIPKYCSNKCRTAAYRARKKESGFDGGANRWQDARNDKTETKTGGRKHTSHGTERERQNYQDTQREQNARTRQRAEETHKHTSQSSHKHTSQSARADWWTSKDPYAVLGVTYVSTKAEIKKAWMKLIRQYHPDVSKDPNATVISQSVNAAYDKLKK